MRHLTEDELASIRAAMAERIREGLEADGRMIKALDAHLPSPAPDLTGRALVVDLGGTNMRAAIVELDGGRARLLAGPVAERLDLREARTTREAFFGAQAALAKQLDASPGMPVGYCFSYPSEVLPSLDATLIRWTKGIDVPGVEGSLVGEGLAAALATEDLAPRVVHVLNDTVASMLGGAYLEPGSGENVLGLIAGTGSNLAAFFDASAHAKLAGAHRGAVAINLESGNFHPPHLSAADDAVDAASTNPGAQRFEKAVAGYYLPFLYRALRPDDAFDPALGSGELVRRRDELGDETAALLLSRSANLIAVAITAVVDVQGHDDAVVVAEGSLFWRAPGFADEVRARLAALEPGRTYTIRSIEHANLIGSACAALTST